MKLVAIPMTLADCNKFIVEHHRHNGSVRGWRFGVGVLSGGDLVGVAVLGRTIARGLHSGATPEVLRCCVLDGSPLGTCSFLYAALWRAWRALGGRRLVTYTLASESGASLRGAGAKVIAELPARKPSDWQNRDNREWHEAVGVPKLRWEWHDITKESVA